MGWGAALQLAAKGASQAAKLAGQAYSAAKGLKDRAVEAAVDAKDAAVAGARAAEKAVREGARDAERAVADKGFDGLGAGGEGVRKAYRAVRRTFGLEPANCPTQSCPQTNPAKATDKDHDGWMMSPQGAGKPCKATPPGKNSLDTARSQAVVSQSQCCKAKRAAGMPQRDIIYVNGINTTRAAHCTTLNAIAAQTCGRVVGVYNATEGGALDAAQTGQDRRLIKAASSGKAVPKQDGRNPAVDTVARQVSRELRAGRKPEIWAHSQGAAVTSLGLFEAKQDRMIATGNPNPLAGVKVKSFGGAAPKWADGPSYEHYVHVNDATPSLFGLGHAGKGDAANAGAGAKVIRFSGDPAGEKFDAVPHNNWLPAATANHGVEDTYLKMEKQMNGGCP